MNTAVNKYDGRGSHRRAIMHMIGQSVDVFKTEPTTAEIAAWMKVSKQTARRHLKSLVENKELIMTEKPYRSNAVIHTWRLDPFAQEHYIEGRFLWDYHAYAQMVMKVILQDV